MVMLMVWMMMVMSAIRRVRQAGNTQRILRVPGICAHRPMIRRRGPEARIAAEPILGAAAAARRRRRRNRGGAAQAGDAQAAAARRRRTPNAIRLGGRGDTVATGAAGFAVGAAGAAAAGEGGDGGGGG